VLLADDRPAFLEAASELLSQRFDVVSTVTDGKSAVEAAMALRPDLVILDISMPVLDGLHAALELKSLRSPAKVVFLTLHKEDDYVVSALDSGARAYVLKWRMASDLIPALERVLGGRMFISRTSAANTQIPPWWRHGVCAHALQFYSDDDLLLDGVGELIVSALEAGDGVCLSATEAHREGLARRVEARSLSVSAAMHRGQYVVFDAAETLASFMSGGELDVARCASTFHSIATSAGGTSRHQPSRVAVYGEMSALACAQGRTDLALQLEQLWSDVATTGSMFTVCGYPIDSSSASEQRASFSGICEEHCAIAWPEGSRT
jgi:CheY-like chemotaxis protein